MSLPSQWVDRIFLRLIGIYGAQFKAKFSVVENGVDAGKENAKENWAHELRNYSDKPEAIAYALDHLPVERAPNALEFRDACRRCPAKDVAALPYRPTEEDKARNRELSHKVVEACRPKEFDGLLWAKKPKSQKAMDMISDAKKNASRFPALAGVYDFLLENQICNEHGKLLHRWDGLAWVKV